MTISAKYARSTALFYSFDPPAFFKSSICFDHNSRERHYNIQEKWCLKFVHDLARFTILLEA